MSYVIALSSCFTIFDSNTPRTPLSACFVPHKTTFQLIHRHLNAKVNNMTKIAIVHYSLVRFEAVDPTLIIGRSYIIPGRIFLVVRLLPLTYSLSLLFQYGHVAKLAEAVQKGVLAAGATCDIFQVPETLPEEVLTKMHAPPKADYPVITDPNTLKDYDGILFGISGRYGQYSAQIKAFMDSTGGLWQTGGLVGKTGGIFQVRDDK